MNFHDDSGLEWEAPGIWKVHRGLAQDIWLPGRQGH